MELDLTGKRALVCGSTQGIGWATALELAELGAEVILMARDASKLKNRASELSAARGQKHGYVVADFHHPEAVAEAADALVSEKPVQILINNTGALLQVRHTWRMWRIFARPSNCTWSIIRGFFKVVCRA